MNNELEKINYRTKYSKRGFGTFVKSDCFICGCDIEVPKTFEKSIYTCSKYCSNVLVKKRKLNGVYKQCRICDKLIWKTPSKNRQYCGKVCADIGTRVFTAERNLIRGTYKKYYGETWLTQRDRARERDGYICQKCGIDEVKYGKQLSVHHKKPFQLFNDSEIANNLSNLICLCEPCHRKEHSGENHHSKYLINKR